MKLRSTFVTSTVILGWFALATPASAEIVYLSSGRTLSVKGHRVEGESIVLTLRNGGEVTCDKSLIEKIVGDEVPYPEPPAAQDPAIPVDSGTLLESTPY